ncbi:MAG: cytochrome C [Pseudomonadota bacterium]
MSSHATKLLLIVMLFVLLITLSSCDRQSVGFALPAGDASQGRATFLALECHHCHSVHDDIDKLAEGHPDIAIELGGPASRIKSYGNLVTSIINPTHRVAPGHASSTFVDADGDSKMRVYNDTMTVTQLVNLTTYLQASYELVTPPHSPYGAYYGP